MVSPVKNSLDWQEVTYKKDKNKPNHFENKDRASAFKNRS